MRFTFVGYVISMGLVACSGGAPYDIPSGGGGGQEPPPPAANSGGGQSSGAGSGDDGTSSGGADASVGKDAGIAEDATVDSGVSLDAAHDAKDARPDATKDAGKDADGTCSDPTDCPLLEACLVNDTPPRCGTNNNCYNGGLCNGGCCSRSLFFDTCLSGNDDTACGLPGQDCVDCRASNQACVAGACQ